VRPAYACAVAVALMLEALHENLSCRQRGEPAAAHPSSPHAPPSLCARGGRTDVPFSCRSPLGSQGNARGLLRRRRSGAHVPQGLL